MATPRPPPPPQPGEKHGMTTRSRATPVPAIVARPPTPHGVDGVTFGVDDAPIDSNGSVTLLSPGTHADDGFLTPRGKTTRVTTGNTFKGLAGSNTSNDNEPPPDPVVAAPAPAPSAFVLGHQANLKESSESKELAELRLQVLVVV
jgi:hypothetical protein